MRCGNSPPDRRRKLTSRARSDSFRREIPGGHRSASRDRHVLRGSATALALRLVLVSEGARQDSSASGWSWRRRERRSAARAELVVFVSLTDERTVYFTP